MIQRIQSIFLFLSSASFFGLFGLPLVSSEEKIDGIFNDQIYNVFDNPILIAIASIGGLLALVALFLFKKRLIQKRLGLGTMALAVIFSTVAIVLIYQDIASESAATLNLQLGVGLPILAIIFVILANRYIGKDEKLVKSMDRLR